MMVKVTKKKLDEALETYAGLVEIYPDNEAYLHRYAEMLQALGRESTATITLQHLYDVIAKRSEKEAAVFAKKHPQIGRISLDEIFNTQDTHFITGKIIFELLGNLWLKLHKKKFKEGQAVYQADELSDSLTLVLEGTIEVYALNQAGNRTLVEKVSKQDILGEQTFLQPNKIGLDAFVTSSTATIVHIPRKKLLQMVEANQHLASMLSQRALFRQYTISIASHSIFKALPLKLSKYLARNLKSHQYKAKTIIHTTSQTIDGIEMVLSGEACYLAQNSEGKKFMLPSLPNKALFGDLTLQGAQAKSTAELFAKTTVNTIQMPYEYLLNISTNFPPLLERLAQHAEQQHHQTIRALSKLKHA